MTQISKQKWVRERMYRDDLHKLPCIVMCYKDLGLQPVTVGIRYVYVSSSWAVILNVSSVYQDNVHHERRRKSETRYILMGKIIDIVLPYHVSTYTSTVCVCSYQLDSTNSVKSLWTFQEIMKIVYPVYRYSCRRK